MGVLAVGASSAIALHSTTSEHGFRMLCCLLFGKLHCMYNAVCVTALTLVSRFFAVDLVQVSALG
jgi:hypothetical protein